MRSLGRRAFVRNLLMWPIALSLVACSGLPVSDTDNEDSIVVEYLASPRTFTSLQFAPSTETTLQSDHLALFHDVALFNPSPSKHLHYLLLLQASGEEDQLMLNELLDSEKSTERFGGPVIFRTREGVRFREQYFVGEHSTGESHRDQGLALLGELGINSTERIVISEGEFTLADLLNDSVAGFHLDQRELAWSAIAYAHYMPAHKSWKNRYGEIYSFNDVANELLERPLSRASCGGIHVLQALACIYHVHLNESKVLSENTAELIEEYLDFQLRCAIRAQDETGSWHVNWHQTHSDFQLPIDTRILATGHMLEFFRVVDSFLEVPAPVRRQALEWIAIRFESVEGDRLAKQYCPYTHSFRCLILGGMAHGDHPSF